MPASCRAEASSASLLITPLFNYLPMNISEYSLSSLNLSSGRVTKLAGSVWAKAFKPISSLQPPWLLSSTVCAFKCILARAWKSSVFQTSPPTVGSGRWCGGVLKIVVQKKKRKETFPSSDWQPSVLNIESKGIGCKILGHPDYPPAIWNGYAVCSG